MVTQWRKKKKKKEPKPTVVPLQNNSDQNEIALEPVAKYVPLINWEQACSWTPTNIDIESASKLPCPVKCSDRTFALEVQGESMEPRFEAGDFIFVDPEQLEPSPGQFIIVQLAVNTPAILKEFQMLDGYKILKALNPNYPADMRYVKVNDTCRLLGTLVSHVKPDLIKLAIVFNIITVPKDWSHLIVTKLNAINQFHFLRN